MPTDTTLDLTAWPALAEACARHSITTYEELADVFRSPAAVAALGVSPVVIARAEKALFCATPWPGSGPGPVLVPGTPPAQVVTIETPANMPIAKLLLALCAPEPADELLDAAKTRLRLVCVKVEEYPTPADVDHASTLELYNLCGKGPLRDYPVRFHNYAVVPVEKLFPARRKMYCPKTGEAIINGVSVRSGFDYTGLSAQVMGLLYFLAEDATLVASFGGWRAVLEAVRSGAYTKDPAFFAPMAKWRALPESKQARYRERVYETPPAPVAPVATFSAHGVRPGDRPHLADVLEGCFTDPDDLRNFIGRYTELARLVRSLPSPPTPLAHLTFALVQLLRNHGLVSVMIDAVAVAYPHRAEELRQARY